MNTKTRILMAHLFAMAAALWPSVGATPMDVEPATSRDPNAPPNRSREEERRRRQANRKTERLAQGGSR